MLIVGFKVHLQNYINKIKMAKKERLAQPLGDRVLLYEEEKKVETTAGGIILPDSVRTEDVRIVKVVAVGTVVIVYSPLNVASTPEMVITIPTAKPCAALVVNVATLEVRALLVIDTVIRGMILSTSYSSQSNTPL